MEKILIAYLNKFPFNGKSFYFDNFIELDSSYTYPQFERFKNWVEFNPTKSESIFLKYENVISENNKKAHSEFKKYRTSLTSKFPTLENASTYLGMFDET